MIDSNRFSRTRRATTRRFIARHLIASVVLMTSMPGYWGSLIAHAEFPEALDRVGRVCGCGWGDGYHSCHSSGLRPLANLPPRSYSARVGGAAERIAGCPNCGPRGLAGVHPIHSPGGPQTFYDRFDQYAAQVRQREANVAAGHSSQPMHPTQPMIDPERNVALSSSPREHGLHSSMVGNGYGAPTLAPAPAVANSNAAATADGTLAAPALSVEELAEFRRYQAAQGERKKFEKYLIEPGEIQPSQIFGGPPVGSEARRQRDEDRLSSSSGENLPLPMDELLPPFPREEELRNDQRRRDNRVRQPADSPELPSRPPRNSGSERPTLERPDLETIPPGVGDRPDDLDSARSVAKPPSAFELNPPQRATRSTRNFTPVNEPQAKIAQTPDRQFVKQPR